MYVHCVYITIKGYSILVLHIFILLGYNFYIDLRIFLVNVKELQKLVLKRVCVFTELVFTIGSDDFCLFEEGDSFFFIYFVGTWFTRFDERLMRFVKLLVINVFHLLHFVEFLYGCQNHLYCFLKLVYIFFMFFNNFFFIYMRR